VKIVVDTNIVFSAILNPKKQLGELLLNSESGLKLYSCYELKIELLKHREKLLHLSKLELVKVLEIEFLVTKNIQFINEEQIPLDVWIKARNLTKDVDEKDTPFVALSLYIDGFLLTNDKILLKGLKKKGHDKAISSNELIKVITNKQ